MAASAGGAVAAALEPFPIEVDRKKALAPCVCEHLCPTDNPVRSDDAVGWCAMLAIRGLSEWRERLSAVRAEAVLAAALAVEAAGVAAAVRAGLSAPPGGEHERPWAQSGALRDSVGVVAEGLSVVVGSSDAAAVPQELGTRTVPARPFLGPVAEEAGEGVARGVGLALASALRGDDAVGGGRVAQGLSE